VRRTAENGSSFHTKTIEKGSEDFVRAMSFFHLLGFGDLKTTKVTAIYNPTLVSVFAGTFTVFKSRMFTPVFQSATWKRNDSTGARAFVLQNYHDFVSRCPWNDDDTPAIIPVAHGTNAHTGYAICQTGFASLSLLDQGFYGRGIYFSTKALYTYPYFATKKEPAIIVSFLLPGNPYPVIEHHKSKETLLGAAIKPGYNSHYVLTESNGDVYSDPSKEIFDEIVIGQESQVVPVYLVEISHTDLDRFRQSYEREIMPPPGDGLIPPVALKLTIDD